jgi:hypothetical protein
LPTAVAGGLRRRFAGRTRCRLSESNRDLPRQARNRRPRSTGVGASVVFALCLGAPCAIGAGDEYRSSQGAYRETPSDEPGWRPVEEPQSQPGAFYRQQPSTDSSFLRGYNDNRAWQAWLSFAPPDYRAGAIYWLRNRGARGTTCDGLPNWNPAPSGRQGCEDAKVHLAPTDQRRKIDASYRLGWNSYSMARRSDAAELVNRELPPLSDAPRAATRPLQRWSLATDFPPPKGY